MIYKGFFFCAISRSLCGGLRVLYFCSQKQKCYKNMSKSKPIKVADLTNKAVLTTRELAVYTGWSLSYIYKLTMSNTIPYSKPNGKTCFFDREEIERYLMSARVQSRAEVEVEAQKIGRAL